MAVTPTLFVDDVEASSRWYQQLLGAKSAHGGPDFEMLMLDDAIVLQLHRVHSEEHGDARVPAGAPRGIGVLLYCQVPDVRAAHKNALAMNANVENEPAFIDLARHTEFVVHDPDGYALALFQPGSV
jgi:catechol 2,3-dioxygenase-like lactoylglutathione lyase family enzyme